MNQRNLNNRHHFVRVFYVKLFRIFMGIIPIIAIDIIVWSLLRMLNEKIFIKQIFMINLFTKWVSNPSKFCFLLKKAWSAELQFICNMCVV